MTAVGSPALVRDGSQSTTLGPVLLAIGDGEGSRGAVRAAELLAGEGKEIRVVSVVDTFSPAPGVDTGRPRQVRERALAESREVSARDFLARCSRQAAQWAVDIRLGLPAQTIAAEADAMEASVVVLGLGQHGLSERLLGSETSLYVGRYGHTPVWSVPPDLEALPRTAVFAIDFSDHACRAAGVALELFPALRQVVLLHAYSARESVGVTELAQLLQLQDRLRIPPDTRVSAAVVETERAEEGVLAHARLVNADLVVAGAHGQGFFSRLVHGSVSSRILRTAAQGILIVPPASPERHAISRWTRGARVQSATWRHLLADFSTRNSGRACVMEVDDPAVGAQVQVSRQIFVAAAYDRRDARVEIMVSDPIGGTHLTRNIPAVNAVHTAFDPDGREVLHVAHGRGQTLLTITR